MTRSTTPATTSSAPDDAAPRPPVYPAPRIGPWQQFWVTVGLLLCMGVCPWGFAKFGGVFDEPDPIPTARSTDVPTLTGAPFTSPTLRDVAPVSVVGPTWQRDEDWTLMALTGAPFAFRVGGTWTCSTLRTDSGDELHELTGQCTDENAEPSRAPTIDLLIRQCDDVCDPAERSRLDDAWFSDGAASILRDATTRYTEYTTDGRYHLVVSHYFPEQPGGELTWHVAIKAECQPEDLAVVQKIVNDIRTQSGP